MQPSVLGTATGPVQHDINLHPAIAGQRSLPSLLATYTGPLTEAIAAVLDTEQRRVSMFHTTPVVERQGSHRAPEQPVTVVLVDEPATVPLRLDAADTEAWPRKLLALFAPRLSPVVSR